jgi:hypothetical protein
MQRHTRQQRLHQALIQLVINNLTSLLVVGWQDCLIRPVRRSQQSKKAKKRERL